MKRVRRFRSKRGDGNHRIGGAVAEAALTLPLFIVIIAATIELSTAIYLKESLTIAAYEGARLAVTRKADNEDVENRVADILEGRGIRFDKVKISDTVTITPAAEDADVLEPITITVSAPVSGNCIAPFGWLQLVTPTNLSATVVMRKEYRLETN